MDRFVLTDAQWAKMEPHCLGKPGDPGRTGMGGSSWRRCYGLPARAAPGVTCPRPSANGTRCSSATATG
jgi:hypothetical protein